MNFKRLSVLVTAGLIIGAPLGLQPASAAAAKVEPGVTVLDTAGNEVGVIESVSGDAAVISTGQHKVALPIQSFALDGKGPRIAMTRVELDAVAAKAAANSAATLRAQLVPGTAVTGASGMHLGTIKEVDQDFVLLASTSGDVRLPVKAFGIGSKGVMIGMSAAEFEAAVGGAK